MSSPDAPVTGRARRSRVDVPEVVTVDQPFDAEGLYALRATLAAHTAQLDVPEEKVEHLLIVASELATNAIRHGGGTGRLRLWCTATTLYCQVSDDGPGIADPSVGSTPPDQLRTGGRGLWICRQLSAEVIITHADQGHRGATVTALISLVDRPPPPGSDPD
jgi:anti-sigma regulatory factor (Ser/Thr protein kinase)